jgi:hypothetical protein
MLIRKRVVLLAADSDRVVCDLHREMAEYQLQAGLVTVHATNRHGAVSVVRLTGNLASNTARPGSYGVTSVHHPVGRDYGLSGGVVFSHHSQLYDRLSA